MRATIFFLLSAILIACSKPRTVVIVEACLKSDKTVINKGDSITFTNCSENVKESTIYFALPSKEFEGQHFGYDFNNNKYTRNFGDTGNFSAVLVVTGEEDTDSKIISIRVN